MGGSQYQAKLLIERLLERYDVEIHYLTVHCDPEHRPHGYKIHRFSSRKGLRRYGYFLDAFRLYRALRKLRPDIVYQQIGCAHTGIAACYARRNGAAMVWRVASDRSLTPARIPWWKLHHRIERAFLLYGIRNAHLILAQTTWQQSRLAARYGRSDTQLVRNFSPAVAPPARKTSRRNVIWIANLKPLKNPGAFVRLARSLAGNAEVRFVMIGAPMLQDQWTFDVLRQIEAAPNVDYLGARSQDEVDHALREARVLVNTSDYEGFSNTFVQAWMREVPVVSLHVDPDQLLSAHGLGFLSRTEEQLQRDVGRLLDDQELAADIGRRCREHALRNHSIENVDSVAALLGLSYKTADGAGSPPTSADRHLALKPAHAGHARAMPGSFSSARDPALRQ